MTISERYQNHVMQCWSSQEGYHPIEVEHTEGCWIHTKDGRKIFDLRSAHECINLGFNHPKVKAAVQVALEQPIYVTDDFAVEATARLAQKLAELTPGPANKKIWFGQSGAASVEAAIKTARMYKYNQLMEHGTEAFDAGRQYPFPYKIIGRYRSWHGGTTAASSVSGDPRRWFTEPFTMPGVVFAPDSFPYRSVFGEDGDGKKSADYLEYLIEMEGGSGSVAAVLIEPVVGSNGVIPTPKPYMKRVRELCDKNGLLLIVDETMTGMGRTGSFLAIDQYDVIPDIIIMGKALGATIPLSATIMQEHVARVFDAHIFGHGQSYSGHALACATALANIEILTEEVLPELPEKSTYLHQRLQDLYDRHPSVGEVRGLGMMWTLELVKNRDSKASFRTFTEKYVNTPVKQLSKYLLEQENIYVPGDKFGLWVVPPLIVTEEEIDWVCNGLSRGLTHLDNGDFTDHET
ncbi:MAG: aspartate aminotransferase family protein [Bacteroidota bacterium]